MGTVLVIDDEKAIADMLFRALTRFGFDVLIALDGRKGIEMFDSSAVDVVLTDVLMPGIDGVEVVNHIRRSDRKEMPVIAMSGTPTLLGDNGFDVVLPKPFSIYELRDQVERFCPKAAEAALMTANCRPIPEHR
ncbi:MAG: response regulator [Pseudomonadota bacterium]